MRSDKLFVVLLSISFFITNTNAQQRRTIGD